MAHCYLKTVTDGLDFLVGWYASACTTSWSSSSPGVIGESLSHQPNDRDADICQFRRFVGDCWGPFGDYQEICVAFGRLSLRKSLIIICLNASRLDAR